MPIVVRDETANAVVLTIDNNGNMCFGNGTPINMMTLNGYGLVDINGIITNGVGSSALTYVTGSSTTGYVGNTQGLPSTVTFNTIANVTPTVQINTTYPSGNATVFNNEIQVATIWRPVVIVGTLTQGSFTARNTSRGKATDAGSGATADPGTDGDFSYRWR